MVIFTQPIPLIILILMTALNVASVLFEGIKAKIYTYVAIALHIAIAPALLFSGAELVELALAYMISLFATVLTAYIKGRVKKRREHKEDENDL